MLARIGRHWRARWHPARKLLASDSLERIEHEVGLAEQRHSGEIRVAIETSLTLAQLLERTPARERARQLFAALGVWNTEHNNGVLIYILLADQSVEIVADRAIAARVPPAEWQAVCDAAAERFRAGQPTEGCCVAIRGVASHLVRHFAGRGPKDNELPNQPVLL